jgi:hypothetical protein
MSQSYLGDWGANDIHSPAGDALIDRREAADEAASGEWEYLAHTENRIAWHVPETNAGLQLKRTNSGWELIRATTQQGPRHNTLGDALEAAHEYMNTHPDGGGRYR